MLIVTPSVTLITPQASGNYQQLIELAGRTCYKSERRISETSHSKFCRMLVRKNHLSVLEHVSATFRFITSRGVTHELVRHRLASFSQESTRYCDYEGGVTFCAPWWAIEELEDTRHHSKTVPLVFETYEECYGFGTEYTYTCDLVFWLRKKLSTEEAYKYARNTLKWPPQKARGLLTIDLKTEIVHTANLRQWLHECDVRTAPNAHPDIRLLFQKVKEHLTYLFPDVCDEHFNGSKKV